MVLEQAEIFPKLKISSREVSGPTGRQDAWQAFRLCDEQYGPV